MGLVTHWFEFNAALKNLWTENTEWINHPCLTDHYSTRMLFLMSFSYGAYKNDKREGGRWSQSKDLGWILAAEWTLLEWWIKPTMAGFELRMPRAWTNIIKHPVRCSYSSTYLTTTTFWLVLVHHQARKGKNYVGLWTQNKCYKILLSDALTTLPFHRIKVSLVRLSLILSLDLDDPKYTIWSLKDSSGWLRKVGVLKDSFCY